MVLAVSSSAIEAIKTTTKRQGTASLDDGEVGERVGGPSAKRPQYSDDDDEPTNRRTLPSTSSVLSAGLGLAASWLAGLPCSKAGPGRGKAIDSGGSKEAKYEIPRGLSPTRSRSTGVPVASPKSCASVEGRRDAAGPFCSQHPASWLVRPKHAWPSSGHSLPRRLPSCDDAEHHLRRRWLDHRLGS